MEVIHVILGKANPERMNGVNRVVHEMASNQVRLGYKVEVWGITANPVHDYPARPFTTRLFKASLNPFGLDPSLKRALDKRKNHIVVHLHGAFLPVFYSLSGFLRKKAIPFILTPHSTYNRVMMQKNPLRKKIYFHLFEKRLLDRMAAVHLLGKTEWEGLGDIYNNSKSVLIPYGFTPSQRTISAVKPAVFTAAYCGRIAIYPKGLDIMLEGFRQFHQRFPQSQLIIIGDGKERKLLEQQVNEYGLSNAIVFTGSLFGEEKVAALERSHVFVHPSRTDGLPATIVEAASLGLPCIVSAATNTDEYIARYNAGYAMPELSAAAFAEGLEDQYKRMMEYHQLPLLQTNALRMINEVFNWERILQQFNNIYTSAFYHKPIAASIGISQLQTRMAV